MNDAERHRGPDAGDVWSDGVCTLGHRRLAIIDLTDAGQQPMTNEDGTIWITFNGEVYNFQALRRELEAFGHRFKTRADTEVVIHAYEQWGTECVKRLRGMFAFGLWDRRNQRLLLARDRAGKKPIFYTSDGNRFLFASELGALLADPTVPREVNVEAIDAYLSLGYVPAPQTAFRGIYKLLPAHWLTLEAKKNGWDQNLGRYWSLNYLPKLELGEDEACEALREELTEAVRLRMISDVPLGAFLSGGIDSSIVVGLMAQLSDRPVKTFSIGFSESAYNELPHARRVADRWGTDHQEFIVEPDALSLLPKLVRHFGEPFADSSAIPTFCVSQMTRASVTVALTGDGGDESFAGYDRYWANRVAARVQQIPGLSRSAGRISRWLPDSAAAKSQARRAKRFLSALSQPMPRRYSEWVGASAGTFNERAKRELYSGDLAAQLVEDHPGRWTESLFADARHHGCSDPVDAAMAVDVRSYLPYDLLVKVDITSMANSLEARSPLLDHKVMELAARLPVNFKLRGRQSKYLLKRAFADLLPKENIHRSKMGFGVPVGEWFRGQLRPLLEDALLSGQSLERGYFRPDVVRNLVHNHLNRRSDNGFSLWNLLMLELWHREVVEAAKPQEFFSTTLIGAA